VSVVSRTVTRIRVLVVDDHEVVRHGLRQALEREADMEVVGEARCGADAIRLVLEQRPDVVLLDVKLEDMDGPEVCRRVLAAAPTTGVVMLTSYLQDSVLLRSLTAGARGYLIKDVELHEVKRAVRAVHRGHSVLDPKIASRVIATATAGHGQLRNGKGAGRVMFSDTDLAILKHLAKGCTNKQIGTHVHLSAHTIKDHLEKMAATLKVRSRTEIVAEALRAGLI
jgi:two-component system, NarL family, response regulator DevR